LASLARERLLMGKVALVTGGAVRVGRALSLGLAEAGFDVAVNYHSSAGPAEEVAARIEELGRRALLVPGDVSSSEDVDRIAVQVRRELGRMDLLVNSASNFHRRSLLDVDAAEWDEVMAVNLKGPFLVARAFADLLREARGSIVNIVDLGAIQPWMAYPHHAVSKAGLLHLTRVLALALAPEVRVNAVAPGTVLPPQGRNREALEQERNITPLRSLGTPQDVVRTVLFLEASPFITGELIVVDGGLSLVT
jgi:NAD(P)-dependent dehydrogenase (short-subunit alcohol dehydrogenase family)